MKSTFSSRILSAAFVLAAMVFATSAFAAKGIIVCKPSGGTTSGKSYSSEIDANGKFSFKNVEPGKYNLVWVLPEGTDVSKTGACSIHIESFSFGASNSTKKAAIQDNQRKDATSMSTRTTTEMSPPSGGASKVSVHDISITRQASSFTNSDGELSTVLAEDLVIDDPNPHGEISGMAINEKGLPGNGKPKSSK